MTTPFTASLGREDACRGYVSTMLGVCTSPPYREKARKLKPLVDTLLIRLLLHPINLVPHYSLITYVFLS